MFAAPHARRVALAAATLCLLASGASSGDGPLRGTIRELAVRRSGPASALPGRRLSVYLPPGYRSDGPRLPVLYVADGQHIFDQPGAANGGWWLNRAVDELLAAGRMRPVIIVGIPSIPQTRREEYMGWAAYYRVGGGPGFRHESGDPAGYRAHAAQLADAYEHFLLHDVKPLIDSTFCTAPDREHTAIAGSSFGGGVALRMGFRHRDTFSCIGALSAGHYHPGHRDWTSRPFISVPALLDNYVGGAAEQAAQPLKIYLDCGRGDDLERTFFPTVRDLAVGLQQRGFTTKGPAPTLRFVDDSVGGHNELAWRYRSRELMLPFLFSPLE